MNKVGLKRALTGLLLVLGCFLSGCASDEETPDPTKGWSVEKLYSEGKAAQEKRDCKTAVGYYDKLQARFPFGVYAQQAALETVYCYYQDADYPMVLASSASFLKQYPTSPSADYVYYVQGKANAIDSGHVAQLDPRSSVEAFQSFKTLASKYPGSKYAPEAREKVAELLETLAEYEYNVADFYYGYGAYVAAAGRLNEALKEYPRSRKQEDMLSLLARSYERLGLTTLAYDTVRILQKNFPDNSLIKDYRDYVQSQNSLKSAVKKE